MTILNLVPDTGDDLPSRQISRRIRGLMAERRISGVKMAAAIGMNQKAFSRRYADEVDWSIDELALVARALEVPFGELCAIRDSNPEPADSMPRRRHLVLVSAEGVAPVLPLRRAGETAVRLVVLGGAA
jgi:hypothetical protein